MSLLPTAPFRVATTASSATVPALSVPNPWQSMANARVKKVFQGKEEHFFADNNVHKISNEHLQLGDSVVALSSIL